MSNQQSTSTQVCIKCGKSQTELSHPLKFCAKCKQGSYCSRECQTADWKSHKKNCGKVESLDGGPALELDLSELGPVVQAFNRLPRKQLAPDGVVKNHWHFSIRALPSNPPIYLLYIINPGSRFLYTELLEVPHDLFSSLTAEGRAALVLPMLLTAFINGMPRPDGRYAPSIKAPWNWGTNDTEFAHEMENRLRECGVRQELQTVEVGSEANDAIAEEEWEKHLAGIKRRVGVT